MANYRITEKAKEDLNSIWEYTFDNWSERQADKYYRLLIASFSRISDKPQLGKQYANITDHLYGLKVNRHIIFYIAHEYAPVEIIRILHQSMDLRKHL